MSEENITDTESETPEISPAENFIDAVTSKDYVTASKEFEEMMLSKIDTSMEQEKINLAGQVFNDENPPEDEDDEEDHIEDDYNEEEEEDLDDDAEEDSEEWDEDESNKRMDIIGQNGNDGLHYDQEDEEDESEYDEEEVEK